MMLIIPQSEANTVKVLSFGKPCIKKNTTTKTAAYLVDLEAGGTLASSGITNPQIAYGEDVISRIA